MTTPSWAGISDEGWSAIASSAAVVVALTLGIVADLRSRSDRKDRKGDADRAQASRVAAWVEARSSEESWEPSQGPPPTAIGIAVVLNDSDQPVYYVVTEMPGDHLGEFNTLMDVIPPGQTQRTDMGQASRTPG